MKINYFTAALFFAWPLVAHAEDAPIMKERPAVLVSVIQSIGEDNVKSAQINVSHDVAHHRIRIFSIVPVATNEFSSYGYDFEIVYNAQLASSKIGVSSYRFQHNNQILAFAASQFNAGNKTLGRRLVELLADADPNLFWSSPTHPVITIREIVVGLNKDTNSVKAFLADESEDWATTIRDYGS